MSLQNRPLLELFSHSVKLTNIPAGLDDAVRGFSNSIAQYKYEWNNVQRRKIRKLDKVYGLINKETRTIMFHRNQLRDFLYRAKLSGYDEDKFEIREYTDNVGVTVDLTVQDYLVPRENQIPIMNYLNIPRAGKTIEAQAGIGKSCVFCMYSAMQKVRTGLIVLPRYLDKWVKDFGRYYNVTPDDVLVIKNGKGLVNMMEAAKNGVFPDVKVVLFSLSSLNVFLDYYESSTPDDYEHPYTPHEIMEAFGIGLLGFDEFHQAMHQVYKCILYFHVKEHLYMSATPVSDDEFIMRIYDIGFPVSERYSMDEYNKYIDVYAIEYGIENMEKIRTSYRRKEYSHAAFEDSLRRNRKMYRQYLDMIWSIVKKNFIDVRQEGMKMLIFAAKKETCDAIVGHIRRCMDIPLKVNKYVAEDEYAVLLESDITCSTLGSSGTAVDIPKLVRVLMTTSVSTITANRQAVGRLRELHIPEWADVPMEFYYLYCRDIPKQVEYHHKKIGDLKPVVRSHNTIISRYSIAA